VKQDYRYLLDYARVFALAGTKARAESAMTGLMEVAHTVLEDEMDLHRDFAAEWGLSPADIEAVRKAPTCVAYTNFLVRAADEGSFPEVVAAVDPCGQGYLDTADHMADLATGEHRYTPFIGKYTGEELRESVAWMRDLLDRCGEEYPGEREAMREAFLTSARLEHEFWEMCYTREDWSV
jgi:thiaminase/transcriptional activator TenA